jgi:hypothetical protein
MKIGTVQVTTQKDMTMVWYLNEEKVAIVCNLTKNDYYKTWEISFNRDKIGGFSNKAEAVSHARKILKWNKEGKYNFGSNWSLWGGKKY